MKPKITIFIPTYNQEANYLKDCVRSALGQRYDSLEIIISENHSTNDTRLVLSEFSDPRLKIVMPPTHVSMADNFRFCVEQASGEYLTCLSSDDKLHPDFCAQMSKILDENPMVAFAHSAVARIDKEGKIIEYERSIHPSFIRNGIQELQRYIWGQRNVFIAVMIRKTAYQAIGGVSTDLDMVGDWYLSLRLLTVGDVAYNSNVLAYYRDWSNEKRRRRIFEQIKDIRIMYERIKASPMIDLIQGRERTLKKARRRRAINIAISIPVSCFSSTELQQIIREIKLLNDSFVVRVGLFLRQTRMGFLFSAWRKIRSYLRKRIKSLLYLIFTDRKFNIFNHE